MSITEHEALMLLSVNEAIASILDLEKLLQKLADIISGITGLQRAAIASSDEDGHIKAYALHGYLERPTDLIIGLLISNPLFEPVLRGEVLILDFDNPALPAYAREYLERLDVLRKLIVPIMRNDRLIGVITSDVAGEKHEFTNREINLIKMAANQAAIAIDNARLYGKQRKAVKDALDSRRQVLDILESINDGFFALDNDWRFTYVNQRAAQFIGRKREDLLFKNMWEALPELQGTVFYEEYYKAKESMVFSRFDAYYAPSKKWFEIRVHPFKNGLSVYFTEITELKERERLSGALNSINIIMNQKLNFEEIIQKVIAEGAKAIDSEAALVFLRKGEYWVISQYLYRVPEEGVGVRLSDEQAPCFAFAARTKKPVVVEDVARETGRGAEGLREHGVRSALFVPLIIKDEVVGIMSYNYLSASYKFSEAQLDFGSKLAVSVSLALENARLLEEMRFELERSSFLLKATDRLTRSVDLQTVFSSFIDIIQEATGKQRVVINEFNPKTNDLTVIASKGKPVMPVGEKFSINRLPSDAQQNVIEGKSAIADYESSNLPADVKEPAELFQARLILLTPIRVGQRLLGYVSIDNPGERNSFSKKDVDMVEAIAAQAAVAIENAMLHEQTEEELSRTKLLQDVAIAATTYPTLDDVAGEILKALMRHLRIKSGDIKILDEANQILRTLAMAGHAMETMDRFRMIPMSLGGIIMTRAVRERRVMTHLDEIIVPETLNFLKEVGLLDTRYMVAPMEYRGKIVGALSLSFSGKRDFTDAEIDLFRAIGHIVGQAIENAHLYEAERHIANTLQTSLLEIPERIHGIKYGSLYRSATEAAHIGGDFYDLFELEGGRVGIVIGDVSGKGIEATALTTVVKNTIKAHTFEDGSPAQVMSKTNDLVAKVSLRGNFVTVFFGVLDTATGALAYCSAGHPPSIIKRENGHIDLLTEHSPVIGAFPKIDYRSGEDTLGIGDVLVCYTDGIIEARCEFDFYGEQRLVEFMRSIPATPVSDIPREILNDMQNCPVSKLTDDVAVLAVAMNQ